jgi:hypothetical protein
MPRATCGRWTPPTRLPAAVFCDGNDATPGWLAAGTIPFWYTASRRLAALSDNPPRSGSATASGARLPRRNRRNSDRDCTRPPAAPGLPFARAAASLEPVAAVAAATRLLDRHDRPECRAGELQIRPGEGQADDRDRVAQREEKVAQCQPPAGGSEIGPLSPSAMSSQKDHRQRHEHPSPASTDNRVLENQLRPSVQCDGTISLVLGTL